MENKSVKRLQVRLPAEVDDWLTCEAIKNMSSKNSEIVRAIRAEMHKSTDGKYVK